MSRGGFKACMMLGPSVALEFNLIFFPSSVEWPKSLIRSLKEVHSTCEVKSCKNLCLPNWVALGKIGFRRTERLKNVIKMASN